MEPPGDIELSSVGSVTVEEDERTCKGLKVDLDFIDSLTIVDPREQATSMSGYGPDERPYWRWDLPGANLVPFGTDNSVYSTSELEVSGRGLDVAGTETVEVMYKVPFHLKPTVYWKRILRYCDLSFPWRKADHEHLTIAQRAEITSNCFCLLLAVK